LNKKKGMDFPPKTDIDFLLNRLLSEGLTDSEKDKLGEAVSDSYNDKELNELFWKHWVGLSGQDLVEENRKMLIIRNKILSRIAPENNLPQKKHKPFTAGLGMYFIRIAAILFVPLLFGALWAIYSLNSQIQTHSSPVVMQHVVATPGSRVHFILPDQSEVWLNSGSSLDFPVNLNQQDERKVELHGEGYFMVAHDKEHPFVVKTEKYNVLALGTSFDVSDYADDLHSCSTLEEGSIAIVSHEGEEIARLNPGQKAILNKSTNKLRIVNVETILTTSWKDGRLIFKNTSLPEVTRQLERWFNCNIHLDSLLLKEKMKYTATIQDETLNEVMKMIEISTQSVIVKIEKREVYISRK